MSPKILRVLILADEPADAQSMVKELRCACLDLDWERVESEAQFLACLDTSPDVILAAYNLQHYGVPQALAASRERQPDVPFIIISGVVDEEIIVDYLRQGAADVISQDRLSRLGPAVADSLERKRRRDAEGRTAPLLRLLSVAMEAAANGIVITDEAGTIIYANPGFTAMTGYARDEAVGQNPRILKSGKHAPQFYRDLWETILAGKVWNGEMTNRRKDGSLYVERQTITPVLNEGGTVTHFIAIKQDVTEHKQLEAQLLQAQKMEVFGQLAGGVAHDFNNLLTVIGGVSEILLSAPANSDRSRELLEQIKTATERASGLTRQLLAFTRKQVVQPQVFDLGALVVEQEKMLRRLIGEDIEVLLQRERDLHQVCADPGQIQQVVLNLAVNARDAMPKGGLLTIALRNVDLEDAFVRDHPKARPGQYVLLEVSDTGCGMAADLLPRVFEPFFTTKDPGKGTGLGLSTVLGIVEQAGGVVAVQSQPGRGTTFRIYLPRTNVSTAGEHMPSDSPPASGNEPVLLVKDEDGVRRLKQSILLVEDDDGVRRLAALILGQEGYTVLEARNGVEALDLFGRQHRPVDLLLTDVVMPEMNGPTLVAALNAKDCPPKVLYMSGYLDDTIVRHGVVEKGMAFLQKPLTPSSLLRKVRQVLD